MNQQHVCCTLETVVEWRREADKRDTRFSFHEFLKSLLLFYVILMKCLWRALINLGQDAKRFETGNLLMTSTLFIQRRSDNFSCSLSWTSLLFPFTTFMRFPSKFVFCLRHESDRIGIRRWTRRNNLRVCWEIFFREIFAYF